MSGARCCVLGATGFLGGQIAQTAYEQGWQVRGLRRRPDAVGAIENVPVDWVSGDLSDVPSLLAAMRRCPLVFHVAGYYPQQARDVSEAVRHGVTGMRNVLAAAAMAGVKRLMYTSALTTLGLPPSSQGLVSEQDLYMPGSTSDPYCEVKWAMEMEAVRAAAGGLPVIIVIPTAVFGPGDIKPNASAVLLRIMQGHSPQKMTGQISVVDGRDVAIGHLAAANRGRPGRRYLLTGHNLEYSDMLDIMAQAVGQVLQQPASSGRIGRVVAKMGKRLGSSGSPHIAAVRNSCAVDSSHTRDALGLPDPIPFKKTCLDTAKWFLDQGYVT